MLSQLTVGCLEGSRDELSYLDKQLSLEFHRLGLLHTKTLVIVFL